MLFYYDPVHQLHRSGVPDILKKMCEYLCIQFNQGSRHHLEEFYKFLLSLTRLNEGCLDRRKFMFSGIWWLSQGQCVKKLKRRASTIITQLSTEGKQILPKSGRHLLAQSLVYYLLLVRHPPPLLRFQLIVSEWCYVGTCNESTLWLSLYLRENNLKISKRKFIFKGKESNIFLFESLYYC